MKNILLSSLVAFSFQSSASSADYLCRSWTTKIEVTLTGDNRTSMWLEDRHHGYTSHGFVTSIEKVGDQSIYHFFPSGLLTLDLTFRTEDTQKFPEKMFGWMVLNDGLFTKQDTLKCSKVED